MAEGLRTHGRRAPKRYRYIDRERETERQRQRDRETERQRDREHHSVSFCLFVYLFVCLLLASLVPQVSLLLAVFQQEQQPGWKHAQSFVIAPRDTKGRRVYCTRGAQRYRRTRHRKNVSGGLWATNSSSSSSSSSDYTAGARGRANWARGKRPPRPACSSCNMPSGGLWHCYGRLRRRVPVQCRRRR
jgi:hypothetical protein